MSFFGDPFHFVSGAASFPFDFQIEQSARFTRSESSYLSRTKQSGGSTRTWTLSFWVKFTGVAGFDSNQYYLYTSKNNASGSYDTIIFDIDSESRLYYQTNNKYMKFDASLTDTSGWYHVVIVHDSNNATAGERREMWLNGTDLGVNEEQSFAQNSDSAINGNSVHYIAARQDNSASHYGDFYLAEMHFVDGYAYDATYFGESKDAPGGGSIWVPIDYKTNTGNYGTTGYYLKFENSGSLGNDSSGNNNDWTVHNMGADHQMADSPTFDDAGSG